MCVPNIALFLKAFPIPLDVGLFLTSWPLQTLQIEHAHKMQTFEAITHMWETTSSVCLSGPSPGIFTQFRWLNSCSCSSRANMLMTEPPPQLHTLLWVWFSNTGDPLGLGLKLFPLYSLMYLWLSHLLIDDPKTSNFSPISFPNCWLEPCLPSPFGH